MKVNGNIILTWQAPETDDEMQKAKAFVVYRFDAKSEIDLNNSAAIQAVTPSCQYTVPADTPRGKYHYVITVLDRVNNESPVGRAVSVKL